LEIASLFQKAIFGVLATVKSAKCLSWTALSFRTNRNTIEHIQGVQKKTVKFSTNALPVETAFMRV